MVATFCDDDDDEPSDLLALKKGDIENPLEKNRRAGSMYVEINLR